MWDKVFSSFSTKFSLTSFYNQYKDKFPLSRDSLFRYHKYFIESMLIDEVRKFSESSYKRMRNPTKIYLVDVGLAKKTTSLGLGRTLESTVFIELKRRGYDIFYFDEKSECDFVAKKDDKFEVYQVTWDLSDKNRKREIFGLVMAAKYLNINEGMILTYDYEEITKAEGITINIVPVWKWLIKAKQDGITNDK